MVLADSNVLLDWLTRDAEWFEWSAEAIEEAQAKEGVAVNPLIYAEVSAGYRTFEGVERALPPDFFQRLNLPYEPGFFAGKAFKEYRRRGGARWAPLPDFFIGAHAQVEGLTLLTRDKGRYQTYFPGVRVIAP